MTYLETGENETRVEEKPLFASIWMALFKVLRKNYDDRHFVKPSNTSSLKSTANSQPGQKLN
jgi:hypothetical protein